MYADAVAAILLLLLMLQRSQSELVAFVI